MKPSMLHVANSMLTMLLIACVPPGDILGTPEYFAQITGTPLELDSPVASCRHYTGLASEGSSVFVWRVLPSQSEQLLASLPNYKPQARSDEAEILGWSPSMGIGAKFSSELQYAEKGECSLETSITSLSSLINSMFESSETFVSQVIEGGDVGVLYIFNPKLNLLAQIGYVN